MAHLHHLALGAHDVSQVAQFYAEMFELSVVTTHHHNDGSVRSIWLALDSGVLMIEQTEEPLRRVQGVGAGPFLIAFAVTPAERAVVEVRLVANDVEIESRTQATSYFRDPEGNRVAISHYPN